MFMLAMEYSDRLLAPFRAHERTLPPQVLRHFLEHVLEHQIGIELRPLVQRAVGHRLLPTRVDQALEFRGERAMTLFRPFAELDQMLLEPLDRIPERPVLLIVFGAIT